MMATPIVRPGTMGAAVSTMIHRICFICVAIIDVIGLLAMARHP